MATSSSGVFVNRLVNSEAVKSGELVGSSKSLTSALLRCSLSQPFEVEPRKADTLVAVLGAVFVEEAN